MKRISRKSGFILRNLTSGACKLNIIVCVKQVPGTSNVEVDPVTGVLKRDGTSVKLNPFDLYALETSFRIRDEEGGSITALSMGPGQATGSLLEAVYMGADRGVLLSDRLFAGADVQATSYVLKCGVEKIGDFDLIVCGKQTTDGDTAQVGPELAEQLGIEHAAGVVSIDAVDEGSITVTLDLDSALQTQKMKLPCLITVAKDIFTPRLPSFRRRFETPSGAVTTYSAADLEAIDPARCGLKGSPTQVERIFPPETRGEREFYDGDDPAGRLFSILSEARYL